MGFFFNPKEYGSPEGKGIKTKKKTEQYVNMCRLCDHMAHNTGAYGFVSSWGVGGGVGGDQ